MYREFVCVELHFLHAPVRHFASLDCELSRAGAVSFPPSHGVWPKEESPTSLSPWVVAGEKQAVSCSWTRLSVMERKSRL